MTFPKWIALGLWLDAVALLAAPFVEGEGRADTLAGVAMLYPVAALIAVGGVVCWRIGDDSRP